MFRCGRCVKIRLVLGVFFVCWLDSLFAASADCRVGCTNRGRVFQGCNLTKINFKKIAGKCANGKVYFRDAYFLNVKFNGNKSLKGVVSFANSSGLQYVEFKQANVENVDFSGVMITGGDMSNIKAATANFSRASFNIVTANKADFTGANFSGAQIQGRFHLTPSSFQKANFTNAKLNLSLIKYVNLNEAIFTLAKLNSAALGCVTLQGAKLNEAELTFTKLSLPKGEDICPVIATGADFSKADLAQAKLDYVSLENTNLKAAIHKETTVTCKTKFSNAVWFDGRRCAANSPSGSCLPWFDNRTKCMN